jgi:hypothetical protein
MTPMQAYKLAITQLLEALIQCRGNSRSRRPRRTRRKNKSAGELEFSPMATALLDELDMAVDDIDMLSGQMHPRVNEIIAELEALNEPGIEDILASVRTSYRQSAPLPRRHWPTCKLTSHLKIVSC